MTHFRMTIMMVAFSCLWGLFVYAIPDICAWINGFAPVTR